MWRGNEKLGVNFLTVFPASHDSLISSAVLLYFLKGFDDDGPLTEFNSF
jgi:hypothetical protein